MLIHAFKSIMHSINNVVRLSTQFRLCGIDTRRVCVLVVAVLSVIYQLYFNRTVKMAEANCVFCSIINGDAADAKLFENERFIIIKDIHPESDYHFLAIPKAHIPDGRSLNRSHIDLGMIIAVLPYAMSHVHVQFIMSCFVTSVVCFIISNEISVMEMRQQLEELFRSKGLTDPKDVSYGFHWPPFISVKHLHLHGIGPVSKMSFIKRYLVFQPNNLWYRSVRKVYSENVLCESVAQFQ